MKRFSLIPLALFCVVFTSSLHAQVDIKINPVGLLFSIVNTGIEFGVKDNLGIEVTPGFSFRKLNLSGDDDYKGSVLRLGANVRYYLNPNDKGLNGFYIGAYNRFAGGSYKYTSDSGTEKFNSSRYSIGFLLGGKIVARNEKLLFDFGTGFGRALVYKFTDPDGTNSADVSDIPFLNWDIPFYITVGYRFNTGK